MSVYEVIKYFRKTFRQIVRNRTMPMSVDEAESKREFFAKMYFLSALGAFTVAMFSEYKKKTDAKSPNGPEDTIKNLKLKGDIRVVKYEGFSKVADYVYKNDESNEKNENNTQTPDANLIAENNESDDPELLKL